MAKALNTSQYPPEYFAVIREAHRLGSYSVSGTMSECMSLRFDLYAFRKALRRENHLDAVLADSLRLLIQETGNDSANLLIVRSDNSKLAQMALRGLRQPEALFGPKTPQEFMAATQPVTERRDPMESALEKLGFFTSKKDSK